MPNKPYEFPEFEPMSFEDMESLSNGFNSLIKDIVKKIEIDEKSLSVSKLVIYDIIERVEKRRVYFHIFHKGIKMGEINECSLYCFWILKLCPFHYKGAEKGEINQVISFYIFVSILKSLAKNRNQNFNLTEEKYHNLYYAFHYRDLSKEAIMALAQSLIC